LAAAAAWRAFAERCPQTRMVDLILPDLQGIARGKRLPADGFAGSLESLRFATSVYALDSTGENVDASGLIWEEGDADRPCAVDLATLAPVPWREGGAQVLAGLTEADGRPFFADPRAALRRVAGRFEPLGLVPTAALELEFYLVERAAGSDGRPRPAGDETGVQVFSLDRLERQAVFFATLERYCEAQGVPAKGSLAEYAPGQYEVNLGHVADPVAAADHAFLLKRATRAAAASVGLAATFMAKPFIDRAANGLHIHVSLAEAGGGNRFARDDAALRHAVGGLQATMAEAMLLFAPNANSFRRLRPRSYAPLSPSWGYNNRTVALRIPDGPPAARRIEHRVAGADANPYLALAAVLAGIHHGLTRSLEPDAPVSGNAYEQVAPSLPASWDQAIEALAKGGPLQDYLGADLCRLYRVGRAAERDRFNDVITPLEYRWYQGTV
jgi:glutamine synthetase